MGCGSGQKEELLPQKRETVNGTLKITLINAVIHHQTSSLFSMDPYAKLKISNQAAVSKVISKGGKQPVFNETFSFFINSCYKLHGRFLELELWDSNKTSDSLVGFGITDLDPILVAKQPKVNIRVFLNYDLKPAGIVNAVAEFREEPIEIVSFRFETASIRRKTSTVGSMNCYVKVTIGEEVLKTSKQKDTKEMPPVWSDEVLTFNVPKVIKNCLIQVYDDDDEIGDLTLTVEQLLKETKEQSYDQEFDFKDVIAGTLRFQSIVGVNPVFSEPKRNYKKKVEEKKDENKDTKKEENKDQKKEEQTKPAE